MLNAREVLLVDALEVRWVPLKRMLESKGAIVTVIDSLSKVRETAIVCLPALMCIEADEGDFLAWLEERLQDSLLRRIPVIGLCGGVQTESRLMLQEKWRALGVSEILVRPHRVSHLLEVCQSALKDQERHVLDTKELGHLVLTGALTGMHESEVELELPLPFGLDQGLELEAQWLEPLGLKSMMIQTLAQGQTIEEGSRRRDRARLIGDTRKISNQMDRLWNWKLA